MSRLLARLRCALSASHDNRTVGSVTTCARGCGFRYVWPVSPLDRLAPRQHQILLLMARGRSVSEIAGDLGVKEPTVKEHITAMYRRLGVHSREEAYAAVGWLVVPEEAA